MRLKVVCLVILTLTIAGVLHGEDNTTVFLVRHAEKAKEPKNDPVLTSDGQARAQGLVRILGNAGIEVIVSSQFARTRLTAEPLAKFLSLPIQDRDAAKSEELANEILTTWKGKRILISGHSNTLPEIIEALGGPHMEEIDESLFDDMFILTIGSSPTPSLIHLKYGKPMPEK